MMCGLKTHDAVLLHSRLTLKVVAMKHNIVKVFALSLGALATFVILNRLTNAQSSSNQNRNMTGTQAAPTEKPVEQVFKNIKVLNGMPQSKLYPTMRFMAASLGLACGDCHVIKNFIDAAADDKPAKQTAREMIKMVIDLNKLFRGNPAVSCYTCHRGRRTPQGAPALPLQLTSPSSNSAPTSISPPSLPSADEILNRYFVAIGGRAATDRISSCIIKGTTTTAIGQTVPYEAETIFPNKGHEAFALPDASGRPCTGDSRCEYERVINGRQGWLKSGGGVQELVGEQLADQKLTFPLFQILRLKDEYASLRFSGREKIDDRDVYVVNAVRLDDKSERLYFDAENGLLRRRISYLRSLVGTIPQQTDFEDYREIDGVRMPFAITISYVDPGSRPIIRKFAEIKLNVPVADSKFDKPSPAKTSPP